MFVSMDVTFWETEVFYSPSKPSLQGEHQQEEEMFTFYNHSEGEKFFYDHSEGEKENTGEEPVSVERETHDIGGEIEEQLPAQRRLQGASLQRYARRKNGKSSCTLPPCQSQSPTPVPDSSADSSGNDSSLIEPPPMDPDNLPIAIRKGCIQDT
ncbi:uncharacterized protein LOC131322648 isoform X2 [Rhododendron vialii]|uniref:uncharacterized protein LOC131322648 isoform X2 n=1 Tax=Rhododendron vialii TaxID=182163 RepID=UPI00265E30EC|nr:uncharacterized protein LOC131322648 isoform X2 [Rhododendron vialii]